MCNSSASTAQAHAAAVNRPARHACQPIRQQEAEAADHHRGNRDHDQGQHVAGHEDHALAHHLDPAPRPLPRCGAIHAGKYRVPANGTHSISPHSGGTSIAAPTAAAVRTAGENDSRPPAAMNDCAPTSNSNQITADHHGRGRRQLAQRDLPALQRRGLEDVHVVQRALQAALHHHRPEQQGPGADHRCHRPDGDQQALALGVGRQPLHQCERDRARDQPGTQPEHRPHRDQALPQECQRRESGRHQPERLAARLGRRAFAHATLAHRGHALRTTLGMRDRRVLERDLCADHPDVVKGEQAQRGRQRAQECRRVDREDRRHHPVERRQQPRQRRAADDALEPRVQRGHARPAFDVRPLHAPAHRPPAGQHHQHRDDDHQPAAQPPTNARIGQARTHERRRHRVQLAGSTATATARWRIAGDGVRPAPCPAATAGSAGTRKRRSSTANAAG